MAKTIPNPKNGDWNGLERRRANRKIVSETVLLSLPCLTGAQVCGVRDLAAFGAGLDLRSFKLLPTEFALSFDGFRTEFACRLVWRIEIGAE
jgi:hypothetical protein